MLTKETSRVYPIVVEGSGAKGAQIFLLTRTYSEKVGSDPLCDGRELQWPKFHSFVMGDIDPYGKGPCICRTMVRSDEVKNW